MSDQIENEMKNEKTASTVIDFSQKPTDILPIGVLNMRVHPFQRE
jgi:hypothetical protein